MALTFGGMTCRCKRPETISKQALKGSAKSDDDYGSGDSVGYAGCGRSSHHATQNAAPAPNAIMRRSNERRPRTEARSVILARTSEQSAEKTSAHLRSLITEAHPQQERPTGNTNQTTTAPPPVAQTVDGCTAQGLCDAPALI